MVRFKKWNLREWFYDRGFFMVLALALAILAWLFVHSGQITRLERSLKIEYINLPLSLTYSKPPPQEIQVLVTGSFHRVRSLESEDLTYLVDLRNSKVGRKVTEVDLARMRLPFDIRISNPNPARIELEFEELISREIPVHPVYQGKLGEGYVIESIRIEPDPVNVSGPQSVIESLEQLHVEVSLKGKTTSFTTQAKVTSLPQVEAIDSVFVEVEIQEVNLQRTYREVPVKADSPKQSMRIIPETANLSLEGTQALLDAFEQKLFVNVPTEGLSQGKYRLRGTVQVPEGIKLLKLDPETFIVEVLP